MILQNRTAPTITKDLPKQAQAEDRPKATEQKVLAATTETGIAKVPTLDEAAVRRFEQGIVPIGFRIDREVAITKVTAWALTPEEVVVPTSILRELEAIQKKTGETHESIVVCTPTKTLAVLSYEKGGQEAAEFCLARLEAPLERVESISIDFNSFRPVPGQELAMLYSMSKKDDLATIASVFGRLKVERIERSPDKSVKSVYCSASDVPKSALGAPVFDAHGNIAGCVDFVDREAREVRLTPVSRLRSLLERSTNR